jgi:glycosyltransferase involved in cell wall biosynthesis
VGLVMIVRNESETLPRLAASVVDQIDYWTIVDTGSTDDTPEVARRVFASVPGQLIQDTWRGFSASRNVALKAAEDKTDWLLFLDADHELHGELDRAQLEEDIDALEIQEWTKWQQYYLLRLVRSRAGWEWRGRTHEWLALQEGRVKGTRMVTCSVFHHADGGSRSDKYERDLALLQEDWAENPGDARTAFYLGRTYEDLGRPAEAAEWYRRRLEQGGWDEEVFFARWRLGLCLLGIGAADEACGVLWRAWGERTWHAEPLVALAHYYRDQQLWTLSWETIDLAFRTCEVAPDGKGRPLAVDRMFVDQTAQGWAAAFEASVSAWHVGQYERGAELTAYLLTVPDLPDEVVGLLHQNARVYSEKLGRPISAP